MKIHVLITFFVLITMEVFAQQPVISNISKTVGYHSQQIEISGSGFSTNPANLVVQLGAMNAVILSSTDNFIEAQIPIGATISSISVTHKTSGLTGYSSSQFFQTFPGENTAAISIANRTIFDNPLTELFDLAIVDLDEDGKNDIITTEINTAATNITIYQNTTTSTTITFAKQTAYIGNPTVNVATGDVDGDGKVDLVISRGGDTNRNEIYVLRNTSTVGTISFAPKKSYYLSTGHLAKTIVIRDLDLDGKPEVIVSNTASNEISIFKNSSTAGSINLSFTPTILTIEGATKTNGLAIEDLNNDGKPDLVITQFFDSDIFIIPNESVDGNLILGNQIIITLTGNLNNVEIADLNLDGNPDILVTMPQQTKLAVLKNLGAGFTFDTPITLDTGLNCWGIGLGDYTGNGNMDVTVTASSGNTFAFFENNSQSGTIELTLTKFDIGQTLKTRNAVIGDLSGDAKPDMALTTFSSTTSQLLVIRNTTCIQPILPVEDLTAEICNGQPPYRFDVAPAEGTTFIWKKSGVEVKNSLDTFYDTDIAGSYTVTAVSETGSCSIESAPFSLTVTTGTIPTDPVASNSGISCIGSSTQLFSTTVGGGATYLWTGPNGYTSTEQNPILTNLTPEMSGIYTVVGILAPCKSAESSTIVETITPPDFTIVPSGPTEFCIGSSITLTVASEIGYTYQWQLDGVDIAGATLNTYNTSNPGIYQVLVSNINCNLSSNQLTLSTFPLPIPSFDTSSTLCINTDVSFTNTTPPQSGQTSVFNWDFGDGTTSTDESPVHAYSTAQDYTVTFTIDYLGQTCTGSTPQIVPIASPNPLTVSPVIAGSIPFCEGDSSQIEASGDFTSYLWNTNATTSIISVNTAGYYSVEAISTSGCLTKDSIEVTTNPLPVIIATARPDTVQLGQNCQLSAEGGLYYAWTPEEGLDSINTANPIASLNITTTYFVTGTDSLGCIGSSEVTVTVKDSGNILPVKASKVFSPNGDGIDDLWVIEGIENFPDCEIVIFNRLGKIIFTKTGYNNDWNGIDHNGNELPIGAYYYTISCTDTKTTSGSISIIR